MQIALRDQHDVEVPRQPAVLESVVEQVSLRPELLFGKQAGGIAIFADNDGHTQLARDQQRLIAEFLRRTCRIDQRTPFVCAAIAAREHVEGDAALLQQFAQHDEKRRLAGASGRDAANADHGPLQPVGTRSVPRS